jgi:hypothetical protein
MPHVHPQDGQECPSYGRKWFDNSDSLLAAHQRSEETMHFNHFDSTILGAIINGINGQGFAARVEDTHRTVLRVLVAKLARRLALRLGSWRSVTCAPAATKPAMAMCPSYLARRPQRDQRCRLGDVVVGPGTVGVC